MSDDKQDKSQFLGGSWAKLFHRSGLQVSVQFFCQPLELMGQVDAMLAQGWLPNAPGVEPGEERETVAYVVHGEVEDEGETTPYLLLYSENETMKWSFLKVYLNNDKQRAEFEAVSGMKVDSIPLYIGRDKPERGKSKQIDNKFIVPCPRPFHVVLKQNPKWSEEAAAAAKAKNEMYTTPKRVFVRWADSPTAAAQKPADDRSVFEKATEKINSGSPNDIVALLPLIADRHTEGKVTDDEFSKLMYLAHETIILKQNPVDTGFIGDLTAESHQKGWINDKQLKDLVELAMSKIPKDALI